MRRGDVLGGLDEKISVRPELYGTTKSYVFFMLLFFFFFFFFFFFCFCFFFSFHVIVNSIN